MNIQSRCILQSICKNIDGERQKNFTGQDSQTKGAKIYISASVICILTQEPRWGGKRLEVERRGSSFDSM